jgi:glycosyltransferase involved in cell wall biosynthesis
MIEISVIVPVRNGARFIAASVDSILDQQGMNPGSLQVLVVDNGSSDNTVELVRERFSNRVELLEEPTPGPAAARNAGLARAQGQLIAFLDADDLWQPDKLQRQKAVLEADSSLAIVFCHGEEFSDPPGAYPCRPDPYPLLSPCGFLGRRQVYEQSGPLPCLRAGEFIAWFGWAKEIGFRSGLHPDVLVRRRIHSHNTTRDRRGRADYVEAMHWLLQKRRRRAENVRCP